MSEITSPRFEWGQRVAAAADLFNDGSHPHHPADALLAGQGRPGEIVQVGLHEESQTAVYMVEFEGGLVLGCLEHEIEHLDGCAALARAAAPA